MNKFKTPLLILTFALFIGCSSPRSRQAHSFNKNIRTPNHPRMASHDRERSDFRHDKKEKKKEQIKKYYEGKKRAKPAIIKGAFDKPSCCKGKNEKSKKRIK